VQQLRQCLIYYAADRRQQWHADLRAKRQFKQRYGQRELDRRRQRRRTSAIQTRMIIDLLHYFLHIDFEDPPVSGLTSSVPIDFMRVQTTVNKTASLLSSFCDINGEALCIYGRSAQGQLFLALTLRLSDCSGTT